MKPSYRLTPLERALMRQTECAQFRGLQARGYSLAAASRIVGRSPSHFSGKSSVLVRSCGDRVWHGSTAGARPSSDFANRLLAAGWLVPAARFFYLNRKKRSLPLAIARVLALPSLPIGWKNETRGQFLRYLQLDALPTCPPDIREAIEERRRSGRALVTESIARLITGVPGESGQRIFTATIESGATAAEHLGNLLAQLAPEGRSIRIAVEVLDGADTVPARLRDQARFTADSACARALEAATAAIAKNYPHHD